MGTSNRQQQLDHWDARRRCWAFQMTLNFVISKECEIRCQRDRLMSKSWYSRKKSWSVKWKAFLSLFIFCHDHLYGFIAAENCMTSQYRNKKSNVIPGDVATSCIYLNLYRDIVKCHKSDPEKFRISTKKRVKRSCSTENCSMSVQNYKNLKS